MHHASDSHHTEDNLAGATNLSRTLLARHLVQFHNRPIVGPIDHSQAGLEVVHCKHLDQHRKLDQRAPDTHNPHCSGPPARDNPVVKMGPTRILRWVLLESKQEPADRMVDLLDNRGQGWWSLVVD